MVIMVERSHGFSLIAKKQQNTKLVDDFQVAIGLCFEIGVVKMVNPNETILSSRSVGCSPRMNSDATKTKKNKTDISRSSENTSRTRPTY
jgi:UDP-N-acetylglucosamine transferase subunit ALG13